MVFLNLFLAILLDNFEIEEDEEEDPNHVSVMMKFNQFKASIFDKISAKVTDILWIWHKKKMAKEKENQIPQKKKARITFDPNLVKDTECLD